jgi:propanediol utilization protein
MNEKPKPLGARVYKRHRSIIKRGAKKLKVSEGEFVRRAIEAADIS